LAPPPSVTGFFGRETAGRRRLVSGLAALAITAATLFILQRGGFLRAFATALETADIARLAAAMAIVPVIQYLRAWRFKLLLSGTAELPEFRLYRIATLLGLINFLVPFRLGEISFPLMARKHLGVGLARATGVLALTRAGEVLAILCLLFFLAALLLDDGALGISRWLLVSAALACVLASLALPFLAKLFGGTLLRMLAPLPRLAASLELMLSSSGLLCRPLRHLQFLTLTFAIWGSFIAGAYLSASAVARGVGLLEVGLAYVASSLTFALPVNGVAGLGPPQAAWWAALRMLEVDSAPAMVTALVSHGIFLVGSVILGLAVLPFARAAATKTDQA
jgi:hypothetical protein